MDFFAISFVVDIRAVEMRSLYLKRANSYAKLV